MASIEELKQIYLLQNLETQMLERLAPLAQVKQFEGKRHRL